jgi:alanine racemase
MRLTRAEIDLNALRDNLHAIRNHIPAGTKVLGLVKANAYGHGLVEVARTLAGEGIDYLGVGFLEEGIVLREAGLTLPILVLGGVVGSQIKDFLLHGLEITVSSLEIARRINDEAGSGGAKARIHVKIDTGMERIGVRAERAVPFVEQVAQMRNLEIAGLYSHLATADEEDKTFAREQASRFTAVLDALRRKGIEIPLAHLANSGAVLDLPECLFDMVRPGIMLYGISPSGRGTGPVTLRPVLSLKSNVVYVKEVDPGVTISYGRTYRTRAKTRIATVPIGYGDGYGRRLSNIAEVIIRGARRPVVGTICMDQLMVDLGPEPEVHVGDEVVLIGSSGTETVTAWEIAAKLGTIPYEIFTGITARVPRLYIH